MNTNNLSTKKSVNPENEKSGIDHHINSTTISKEHYSMNTATISSNFANLSNLSVNSSLQLPLFVEETEELASESSDPVVPDIQVSTMQVPCGKHSIFDPDYYIPEFSRAVYIIINERSTWDTGISHPLSNRDMLIYWVFVIVLK